MYKPCHANFFIKLYQESVLKSRFLFSEKPFKRKLFAGNNYTCKFLITQRIFSEEVIIYNSTKPYLVTLNETNVLTNITTIAHFSVPGFGSMISYKVLDLAKEVELYSGNLTFENSFTIVFLPVYIGLLCRVWAVAGETAGVRLILQSELRRLTE